MRKIRVRAFDPETLLLLGVMPSSVMTSTIPVCVRFKVALSIFLASVQSGGHGERQIPNRVLDIHCDRVQLCLVQCGCWWK